MRSSPPVIVWFSSDLLAEGVARFGYRVHAFCLMTNHLHLALQAGESGKTEGHSTLYYGGKDDSRVVGEEDFVRTVLPSKVTGPKPVSIAAIVAQVCRSARMSEAELLAPGKARAAAHGRALAGWLALKTNAATLTGVAAHFNRDISTLSHAVAALNERARNSDSFANALNQHLNAISQA